MQNIPELYTKRKLFLSSHAGLINLFAKTVMQAQPEKQVEKQAEKPIPEKKEPQRSSPQLDFYAGGKKEIPRPVFSVICLGLLRFQRGNVPVIPETAPDREWVA